MHRMGYLVRKERRAKGDKLKMQGAIDIPTSMNSITREYRHDFLDWDSRGYFESRKWLIARAQLDRSVHRPGEIDKKREISLRGNIFLS